KRMQNPKRRQPHVTYVLTSNVLLSNVLMSNVLMSDVLMSKCPSQTRQRQTDARLDRSELDARLLRDLIVGQTIEESELHDGELLGRKGRQRGAHALFPLCVIERVIG